MRAQLQLQVGNDKQSIVLTVENVGPDDMEVATTNPHLHVQLRSIDGNVVRPSFGSMLDEPGPWRAIPVGGRAELTIGLRRHYAGATGTFSVECQIPCRSSRGGRAIQASGTVALAIPSLPPRDA